ncbi:ATP-binding cassette domain-containing protein [Pediococcus pentosaceus]|jgi:ATP-binding cassette subfamily B multidrug efflux pump|uniref:ABC-type multidrug transport system, ATPase and permease component n=1 Tax=Pediococcus pentosaceus (strain ATCC 25745 / CCUG 21536 / LMG 10740 / 183-1w) TaxID=278197 RepID=Q03EJ4_PEDPA|nr:MULTISPECIES: ABC transporter ATP-binding protein [Pediococcus]ABJ68378.1 ABC-type multidrug transport system, ATPase and permease component [Pediococcus pentosaceus ATCC 25745]KAF5439405.1 ABC transporter ATP-binding protein [Pediococcus sp. EKM202D]KAF5439699.1 ABC transporter ATP-binding protein [Pediococcus sp. EKM201D]QGZ70506.1 ATP-binding cassette domain-containing protein [Pediococcus pentosaceus]QHM65826.1 putative ABC transporter ATP-binding protein [Pediococcus pentosaceus]
MWKLLKSRFTWWAVLVGTVFLMVQIAGDLLLPNITSDIINNGIAKNNIGYIWNSGLKMLLVSLVGLIGAGVNVFFAATQAQKVGNKLRSDLFRKISFMSNYEFEKFGEASLITRTTNDVIQIQNVIVMILRMMLMSPIMLVGAGFMAYQKQSELTAVFLVALPLLAVFVGIIMFFAVPLFKGLQKKIDRINLVFREGLTGVRVIRAFNQDQFEQDRFADANHDYMKTGIKVFTIVSFMIPVMTLLMSGTNIGIVWYGAHLIANQTMQVGNLVAFMTYATQILMSFMMLSMVFVSIPRASASAARINEVLNSENSVKDQANVENMVEDSTATLAYNNVKFRYPGAERLSIDNANFEAKAGDTVAVIGGTGSGKTTLISLLPRLFDPESGSIELNGVDIKKLSQFNLHEQVAFAQQKAVLFKGTIRENMRYGNENATDEEIWHALEVAQSTEFIKRDGDGLDTFVEQNGDNFSGGQKQRLSIARTLVKKAKVYVFDDSFSALDFKTDANLRKALREDPEIQKSIVIIVAQRIATVADADLILVLENGKVVGQGTHAELKQTNKTYREIIESQIKEGDQTNG